MTSTITSQSLAKALSRAGYTAGQLGAVVAPRAARNAQYKAGMRLLGGSHATDVDRLGELARELGVAIRIEPTGVVSLDG